MALTQISTQGIKDGTITGSDLATNVDLVDDQKLRFGTGNDLQIYHAAGAASHINATGLLNIDGTTGVRLEYNNATKLEITSAGVSVTGQIRLTDDNSLIVRPTSGAIAFNTGGSERLRINSSGHVKLPDTKQLQFGGALNASGNGDLQIYHDGTHSYLQDSGTGNLKVLSSQFNINNAANSEAIANFIENGAVELFHDGSKKFETKSYGALVTGYISANPTSGNLGFHAGDNTKMTFGSGDDLQIYHTGTESVIGEVGTGNLVINATSLDFFNNDLGGSYARFISNGAVELYHAGSKKFETTSAGVLVTGTIELTGSLGIGTHTGIPNTKVDIGLGVFAATGDDEAADWGANNVFQLTATGGNAANNQILLVGAHSGGVGQIASGIGFGRDSTTNWGTYLSFKTHSTATSNIDELKERMRIGSNGAINAQGVYDQTTSSSANVNVASDGHIRRSTSSRRYKNTITDATHGLIELLKLKSVTFKGNEDGDTVFGGLIAEDVHNAGLTEFVHYDKDNEPDALAYGNMVALCVKAIQDLNAKVEALEAA